MDSHKRSFFGPYWATFRVENTGSPTLESMHLTIDSAGSACVYQHNAPFMVSSSDCPPGQAALASGGVAFVACNVGMGPLLFINAEATIRLCTQDGGGALCADRTVTVPP